MFRVVVNVVTMMAVMSGILVSEVTLVLIVAPVAIRLLALLVGRALLSRVVVNGCGLVMHWCGFMMNGLGLMMGYGSCLVVFWLGFVVGWDFVLNLW